MAPKFFISKSHRTIKNKISNSYEEIESDNESISENDDN